MYNYSWKQAYFVYYNIYYSRFKTSDYPVDKIYQNHIGTTHKNDTFIIIIIYYT